MAQPIPGPALTTLYTSRVMVATVDPLASQAGVEMLRRGGSAADAAIAANAVLAVTLPNQCGLGGDLFALVHSGGGTAPAVLNASGRAGSGASAERLRDEGRDRMPVRGDVRSATVPGCVDGWLALHDRFGRLPLADLLAPARGYAEEGFPASPYLAEAAPKVAATPAGAELAPGGVLSAGQVIRRPGVGRLLAHIGEHGREPFYGGEFGQQLVAMGGGLFTAADCADSQAEWVEPISIAAWGHRIWGPPPNSQAYLTLAAAWLAERLDLPSDPAGPAWPHLLVEAVRQASYDRPAMLHEHADGAALLSPERLRPRLDAISRTQTATLTERHLPGGTTYLCAVDRDGMGVSLMQSNAMSFGSRLVVGDTGVFLHNRGIGFSLTPGHPAEYAPGRRPPHTLSPALVTAADGRLRAVLGTRGGDSQPSVVLQLLTRLLHTGQDPATTISAPRFVLRGANDESSFDTWGFAGAVRVALEGHAPAAWAGGLRRLGHRVETEPAYSHPFGHAQLIVAEPDHLAGAADPRSLSASVVGY